MGFHGVTVFVQQPSLVSPTQTDADLHVEETQQCPSTFEVRLNTFLAVKLSRTHRYDSVQGLLQCLLSF